MRMSSNLRRRDFLRFAGASAAFAVIKGSPLGAKSSEHLLGPDPREHTAYPILGDLLPMRISQDRIVKETVGLRPFRKTGPNMSVERLGEKTIVHNYGHGGSGWSLSWGAGLEATEKAMATGADAYAVIGCGAVGMTSAVLLLRAGKRVTIYAKERHPNVTSSMATGVWSPDSRICLEEHATPAFGTWWAKTCRASFRMYQNCLGIPGDPIEWVDKYAVSDRPWDEVKAEREAKQEAPHFGHFSDYVKDLTPGMRDLDSRENPFREQYAKKGAGMIFNVSTYAHYLQSEILSLGGKIVTKEFHEPSDFAALPEKTVLNCTGLGAKALFKDKEMEPVRGQLTFLIPAVGTARYQFSNNDAYIIPRRDGLVVGANENGRYGSSDLAVDPAQSFDAVASLARSLSGMRIKG